MAHMYNGICISLIDYRGNSVYYIGTMPRFVTEGKPVFFDNSL